VITGRSDATLNRGGVRLGTAEFYSVLDSLPRVSDSVIVHLEDDSGHGSLIALVAADSAEGDDLRTEIRTAIREQLSPRHVPDAIIFVRALPRNSNGKRLEVPLKRAAQGVPIEEAIDLGALAHPEAFVEAVTALTDFVNAR
jgi:acetoacetyl-CoA synthetase